jgi:hypothetical protein
LAIASNRCFLNLSLQETPDCERVQARISFKKDLSAEAVTRLTSDLNGTNPTAPDIRTDTNERVRALIIE